VSFSLSLTIADFKIHLDHVKTLSFKFSQWQRPILYQMLFYSTSFELEEFLII